MEKSFAKEFTVGSMNQSMRSKNLLQARKRFARSKEQAASREFQPLFLQVGLNFADRAVSKAPCLIPDSFDEFASLSRLHFFCGVIGLAKFVCECFDEVDSLTCEHGRRASIDAHCDKRGPPRMHAKAERRLFRLSHCE